MSRGLPRVSVVCDWCKRVEDIDLTPPGAPSVWAGQAPFFDMGALPKGWEKAGADDVCDACVADGRRHEDAQDREQGRAWAGVAW